MLMVVLTHPQSNLDFNYDLPLIDQIQGGAGFNLDSNTFLNNSVVKIWVRKPNPNVGSAYSYFIQSQPKSASPVSHY